MVIYIIPLGKLFYVHLCLFQLINILIYLFHANHLFDYIELDDRHAIVEVAVPERWVGQTVGELNIRRKYGINLLGLKKDGKTDVSVTPDTHLTKDVTILALGEYQTLKKCFAL